MATWKGIFRFRSCFDYNYMTVLIPAILGKMVRMIRVFYDGFQARVLHDGNGDRALQHEYWSPSVVHKQLPCLPRRTRLGIASSPW